MRTRCTMRSATAAARAGGATGFYRLCQEGVDGRRRPDTAYAVRRQPLARRAAHRRAARRGRRPARWPLHATRVVEPPSSPPLRRRRRGEMRFSDVEERYATAVAAQRLLWVRVLDAYAISRQRADARVVRPPKGEHMRPSVARPVPDVRNGRLHALRGTRRRARRRAPPLSSVELWPQQAPSVAGAARPRVQRPPPHVPAVARRRTSQTRALLGFCSTSDAPSRRRPPRGPTVAVGARCAERTVNVVT